MGQLSEDQKWMQLALEIATNGEGAVEPNPMVGCLIVRDGVELGRGFHQKFGGSHAEVEALDLCAGSARGATAYVTLEPCCHVGKTPACTERLIREGVARVVMAQGDPFPQVMGGGIEQLQKAGIQVDVGVLQDLARQLNAPYLKKIKTERPWVICKWAMTLDGRIATRTGDSKWISSEASRAIVHQLRGRVDAIIVGSQTAVADNPFLTARPPGPRIPCRIVVDSRLSTPLDSRLVHSAKEFPTLFAVADDAIDGVARDSEPILERAKSYEQAGCEILVSNGVTHHHRLLDLLDELGQRGMTNVLVEGGAGLLGNFFDAREVDEIHVFVGNRLVGGREALPPIQGAGVNLMNEAMMLQNARQQIIGDDVYIHGRIKRS